MPSYLVVSENQITLLGPLYSSYQEEAVLKTYSMLAEILEIPGIPLGFVSDYDSFNSVRMQAMHPQTLLNKALALTEDVEKDVMSEEITPKKSSRKSKKLREENTELRDSIEDNLKEILRIKIETLHKIKETYIAFGLYD